MSIDFSPVFEVLSSFTNKQALDKFLLDNKFTFRSYPAKKQNTNVQQSEQSEQQSELIEMENEWIYIIKHPYHQDDNDMNEPVEQNEQPQQNVVKIVIDGNNNQDDENIADDPRLDLLHLYGRGIVFRIDMNQTPFKIVLMSVPLPFGQEDFMQNNDISQTVATVLIDGTGFNVCKDPSSGLLFVSTRACGGYYPEGPLNYFNNSKYRYGAMFREALQFSENKTETDFKNEIALLNMPSGLCLHLVMQHPNDTKVFPVKTPNITLVLAHKIEGTVVKPCQKNLNEIQSEIKTQFNTPTEIPFGNNELLSSFLTTSHPRLVAGLKIYNPNTNSWSKRMLTQKYERVKELVGNDTNIVFTMIRLRHAGGQFKKLQRQQKNSIPENHVSEIKEFLQCFPEYSRTYQVITDLCKLATGDILDCYLRVYAHPASNKFQYIQDSLEAVPREFNDLVQQIHKNYKIKKTAYTLQLESVKSDAERASLSKPETRHKDVMEFFNNMPPARIYDRLRQYTTRKMSELQHDFGELDFDLQQLFTH